MKTIIVPTDFSAASVNAAVYATEIARHIHASIVLLHALPLPITVSEVPLPPDSYKLSLAEAKQSLNELKEQLEKKSNDKLCITCRTTTESFVSEIEHYNQRKDIFAMIMGTSGAGAAETFFLGSFSLAAAKHFIHPLIVVPPAYRFNGIHKIGLACDMRHVSDTVPFQSIRDISDHFDAQMEILYVSKPGEMMYPQVLTETKLVRNNLATLRPEIRITTHDDIKEGLQEFVRKGNIDLLILLPKERSFLENLFHKSITKKVVLHPEIPVMILH